MLKRCLLGLVLLLSASLCLFSEEKAPEEMSTLEILEELQSLSDQRDQELITRETALVKRENLLTEKETALSERQKSINDLQNYWTSYEKEIEKEKINIGAISGGIGIVLGVLAAGLFCYVNYMDYTNINNFKP